MITHDDELVKLLGADYTDKYWNVQKDSNSYSKITQGKLSTML